MVLKGIDFIKSFIDIKNEIILKNLEDISLFDMDNDFVRVNNYVFIVYTAHKLTSLEKIFELHCFEVLPQKHICAVQRFLIVIAV